MEPNTHQALNRQLCGTPKALFAGGAEVELETRDEMRADERGLVHGGFIFGLADHAAMLAINEPNVVLGSAETRFLAPVVVGERLSAVARVLTVDGKRQRVEVHVGRHTDHIEERVFEGTFVCFVPSRHVLDAQRKSGEA
ncbi:MAG: thioesterase superfamily protein [Myxococcaceae bacterium]|nr:thioesterase superfamily protein [Myxococcaceae bacterium]